MGVGRAPSQARKWAGSDLRFIGIGLFGGLFTFTGRGSVFVAHRCGCEEGKFESVFHFIAGDMTPVNGQTQKQALRKHAWTHAQTHIQTRARIHIHMHIRIHTCARAGTYAQNQDPRSTNWHTHYGCLDQRGSLPEVPSQT